MAEKAPKVPGKQLAATVPADVAEAFEEAHWDLRKPVVEIVRDAIYAHGKTLGILDADGKPVAKTAPAVEEAPAKKA